MAGHRGRILRTFVHVADAQGRMHAFGPDDNVPAWAAKRIRDKAWAGTEEDAAPPAPEYGVFDPAEHTVAEVKAFLKVLPGDDPGRAEYERVVAAERAGQNRTTLLDEV